MLASVIIPTAIPDAFEAGTTVRYSRVFTNFPANAGWTLKLFLAGPVALTVSAAASGLGFILTLTAGQTATLTVAGMYRWSEHATDGTDIFPAAKGSVFVTPNLATAVAGDLQTMEEKLLAAIDAVIVGKITDDVLQYSVLGRGLTQ